MSDPTAHPPHDRHLPAIIPVTGLPALPEVHAHALVRLQTDYSEALVAVHGATATAEQDLAQTGAAITATEEEAVLRHAREMDTEEIAALLLDVPTRQIPEADRKRKKDGTLEPEPAARCVCGKPLTKPGWCSKTCADRSLREATEQVEARRQADRARVEELRDLETAKHDNLMLARKDETHAEARLALVRSGKSRADLRDEVPVRIRVYEAAFAAKQARWDAAEAEAQQRYVLERTPWAERQIIIKQLLGPDYWQAKATLDAAIDAMDVAEEVWQDLLVMECKVRDVTPHKRLCLYCGLVPLPRDKHYCSTDCERHAKRDGLHQPLPGHHWCQSCLRTFRNPLVPEAEYCSMRCLLGSPVDVEPHLGLPYDQAMLVEVPKSAAERRRFGQRLRALENAARQDAAHAATGPDPARAIDTDHPSPRGLAAPSATELAREAILGRLREHPGGLATKPLLRGLGRYVVAKAALDGLVADGLVMPERGGKTASALLYRLA